MPDWIEYGNFFYQADVGLRQAYLDARKAENRKHVYNLIKDADVFVDNLRPGVADTEGYSAQALAERKPGIIACSVKLNARRGPWSQVEGMKTPQYWEDPLLHVPGACKPEWLPR